MTYPVLIGSSAYAVDNRHPKDIDIIGYQKDIMKAFKQTKQQWSASCVKTSYPTDDSHLVLMNNNKPIEAEIAWEGTSAKMIVDYVNDNSITYTKANLRIPFDHMVASPLLCWFIKESHKYKDSVHFEKTRNDVLMFRRLFTQEPNGYLVSAEYQGLREAFELREKESYRKPVSLNVNAAEFFSNDGVDYTICPHDEIHYHVKLGDMEAYKYIRVPGQDVMCSKELWDKQTDIIKFACVIEEAMAIAIERGVLPFDLGRRVSDDIAQELFKKAVQKICTSLCSGWFRTFAWENYSKILTMMTKIDSGKSNYINRFYISWKGSK